MLRSNRGEFFAALAAAALQDLESARRLFAPQITVLVSPLSLGWLVGTLHAAFPFGKIMLGRDIPAVD